MPLIIALGFFALLFTCEAIWYETKKAEQEQALIRYQHAEHPRRRTSDFYLDTLD